MRFRFISWGIIPPALFILALFNLAPAFGQPPPTPAIYATIGPEAPAILRVLVGDARVVTVPTGNFADVLGQYAGAGLVVPEEGEGGEDLDGGHIAEVKVIRVKRNVSVAAVEDNIHTLGVLTDSNAVAAEWIESINRGLDQIAHALQGIERTRVLILTPEGYTEGQGAFASELISRAGGINVAVEARIPEARQIDDAQVRQFAPDVVLLIGDWSSANAQALALNPVYQGISAFDRNRVYRIAPPGRDPLFLVSDVQNLANLLHPV